MAVAPGEVSVGMGTRVTSGRDRGVSGRGFTFGEAQGTRTGLHVDSWESAGPEDRTHARNRLCVSAGRQARYFVFCGQTVSSVCRTNNLSNDVPGVWNALDGYLGHPETVAYRLRIEPFEAYIAPTENLIHDGSTQGFSVTDFAMTWLGHFAPSNADAAIAAAE